MISTYDTEFWKPKKNNELEKKYIEYYKCIFGKHNIKTIHDCSFGSGNLTYPLYEMGYEITGSDINENMVKLANDYIRQNKLDIKVNICDFRKLNEIIKKPVDCLISTGNSLPHVKNKDIEEYIENARKYIVKNGFIYFDMRNWDKILEEKQRYYVYDLSIKNDEIINLIQVWDYIDEETIEFNLIFTRYESTGKIKDIKIQKVPKYYPIKRNIIIERYMIEAGFDIIGYYDFAKLIEIKEEDMNNDNKNIDWYSILGKLVR